MEDLQKIKEFFSKPIKENTFKKGDKVTYLGHPGEITGINKEMTGDITYNVAYDKGNGRTKATNIHLKSGAIKLAEAKKEDAIDTITMDVPLFLRILEYSREDAQKDIDLHDVTDKAISLGKERGILSMEDYEEIVGDTEKVDEANVTWSTLHRDNANEKLLKQSKLSSAEYQKAKKLQGFKADNYKWNTDEDLYVKVVEEGMGGQLDEPFFIEVSVRDARKALDLFQDQYRNSNIEMYGSNVYAADTPEDIYDLYYDLTSQDIEILDANIEDEDFDFDSEYEATLMEANVPSNIAEFAKRKGVSSLVRKVAGWAEKVGARIAGGTAVGKNYSTLVLDLDYKQQGEIRIDTDEETVTLYDEPVNSFNDFQRVYADGADNNLEEGEEEQLSFINKARAKSSLRQFLSGKRDDGMGKFDAIVYGIDADGNKHQIKSYNDLQNYEEFALGDNPDFVKEAKNTSLDSKTIKQIKDDIKGFPKYQKRGFESFKKEVRERYKITPKQLEDILHGDLKENVAPNHNGKAAPYGSGYKPLEERIAEALDKINEELCPAGKAYIKRRKAAGEKSSAYLSGRAVKVCKGQMSGRKKKK